MNSMGKTRKIINIFMIILLLPVFISGCNQNYVGKVDIIADGTEHTLVSNWIFGLHGNTASDGTRKMPQEIEKDLSPISVTTDMQIKIDAGMRSYTLYDERYEVYYSLEEFKIPTEKGIYYLCIELAWGSKNKYDGYQYFAKLVVE